ncbi:MAG TPA: energy transducer TonB [Candidatus Angelobacter sp.]|nr:energy transducer TonB [Candidatus Angelobacter sp.]
MLKILVTCVVFSCGLFAQEQEITIVRRVEPVYPQMARVAHIEGEVVLEAEANPDGNIVAIMPVSGHPILIQAATDSLNGWKVRCPNCEGKNAVFVVRYVFTISESTKSKPCFDAAGNAQPCGNTDPLPVAKVRSASCFYLWKCGIPSREPAGSSQVNDWQSQRTPAPFGAALPIHSGSVAVLRP